MPWWQRVRSSPGTCRPGPWSLACRRRSYGNSRMTNEAQAPLLSVVVPTYNRRAGLERLLRALGEQTLPPDQFEVVVVNDGSQDDTADLLATLALPYRLRALAQANAGPAAARNLGVTQAEGWLIV